MALVVGHGVELVRTGRAGLDENVGTLAGRDQELLLVLDGAQLDAVIGDCVKVVLGQIEQHVILIGRVQDAPALDLTRAHLDDRTPLAVDGQEACRGLREQRLEILDHATGVEHDLGQHHHALARSGDFGHVGEVALDDDGAHHAARHLDVGAAVVMRVIPVGAPGVVLGQVDLDVVGMARGHRTHDIVRDAARARMRAVEVEVGVVELVRIADVGRQVIAVRRKVVDEFDLEFLARLHAQGRAGAAAFVGADAEADAANLAIGVGAADGGREHPVDGAADLRLGERLVHCRDDLVGLHSERW